MSTLLDKANELAQVLKESEEFTKLQNLHNEINEDEVAKRMLDNFRNVQLELQQKQMQGQEITEEEVQQAQKQFELVQQHEKIMQLMEEEQRMSQLVGEVNKKITEPLEELYAVDNTEQ
ncbi:YlbF family regulator [Paenalkalicoccus suaedae]|uniref:UPF0342 protein FLK61_28770 n=1 Tax=Paenalkalicoccus suaedae TaxID=2592382 RepID=A0A859FDT5_9BACI|nr:YlbF family regulator [Paenalkalicoccus suaedae]QKS70734.1 YlbF family regulator [Paenalkalicoccus suaedae]